jgi:phage baseplate assembly protein gpV
VSDRPSYGSDNPNQSWLNLNRDGVVYARRQGTNGPEVQVYYADRDLLSDWLQVKQRGSAGAIFHFCPRIGDTVSVENLGTGIEQGVVTGSHATTNNPGFTPKSLDALAMATDDGSYFEHEPQSGTFTLAGVNTLHLSVKGETLAFSGPWTLQSSGAVSITGTDVTINANSITLNAPNTIVTGTLKVDYIKPYQQSVTLATPQVKNADGSGNGS